MKYVITGGAGFIGSNIAARLVADGHKVRILDNFSSGREENLAAIADQIEIRRGNICDFETVSEAVQKADCVFHLAALPSVPRSIKDPLASNEVNVNGTLFVLEASRRAGVKKVVCSSSSSVYGESEELPKHEKLEPNPLSPYAVTKLTGEHYCRVYWELYKFPTVSLRYFNIFGPNQDPNSEYAAVIPKFIAAIMNGENPVVFGDGEQSRDFTYIDNAVEANILAATNDDIVGTEYNVACGAQFSLNQLLDNLGDIMGKKVSPKYDPPRQGDILHSYADISKLGAHGYKPTVGFLDGLKRTVEFFSSTTAETETVSKAAG
ncbi:MAG: SDR family oxidoreductase [candidate division Zixibacteria bacterium]|nr:SDR family oxidoreductase [candidate division Zixibacteria bacterium]